MLIIAVCGAIYGVIYVDKLPMEVAYKPTPMELPSTGAKIELAEDMLLDLAQNTEQSYAYPATELSVRFDFLDKDAKPLHPSSISISNLDEYKFACVKQVLRQNKIESAYYKSGNTLKLMVFLNDEAMYKRLIADLQYYRLSYSVH